MRHLVIPDCQVKEGVPIDHLLAAGRYAAEKKPDVIVCIGDFADMESLSLYDVGKKSFEGRRYKTDIEIANRAMGEFLTPIFAERNRLSINKKRAWNPRFILTLGNHEERINRAVNLDPKLHGVLSIGDLNYDRFGWEVIPFLEPIIVDGIAYCHYFTSGVMGRPVTSAQALLNKKHMSCVMGHVQGRQIAYAMKADGKEITGLFAGSFYQHEEEYLNAQGNKHWRGIWMLNDVQDGSFDEMPVSLPYLMKNYL